ncbi:DUF3526 domain-containing protein [Sphingomonas sp. BK235]|uniref:DUF3526 domain-containing protein n=1 Tax=Sphingomonas sp. BK235 TaxID=2512131 RepID=UPI001050E76C|nr:DUF3526 domain-containing protein [Sphingomonas sp. BK235]TCP32804.1 ABC-2 type transport system permease protein [Sphingomonas sp. BK235]
MTWLRHEWRLLWRSPLCVAALALTLALSASSVWSGLREVARQREAIARLVPLAEQDTAAVAARFPHSPTAGEPAYFTYYPTWDPPSATAFMATGFRDVAPSVLRVRALGLHAQLYDGETLNPELALPGSFDFAFVLVYLAPLIVVVLLHDLVAEERRSGRLPLVLALAGASGGLWRRRAALRLAAIVWCLIAPLIAGAVVAGAPTGSVAVVVAAVVAYVAFWAGVASIFAVRLGAVASATASMAVWAVLTLILPAVAGIVVTRAIPVRQGVALMMAQRQAVHGASDRPIEESMRRFSAHHPGWGRDAPSPPGFQWKWLFVFHQNADDEVADEAIAYRAGLLARQGWTTRLGWILPGIGAQTVLHRVADTDLAAQLAYQDRIVAFHRRLLAFYYPYLFNDRPFGTADFAKRPAFTPDRSPATAGIGDGAGLLLIGALTFAAGMARLGRVRAT